MMMDRLEGRAAVAMEEWWVVRGANSGWGDGRRRKDGDDGVAVSPVLKIGETAELWHWRRWGAVVMGRLCGAMVTGAAVVLFGVLW
ncbi:hypothetical protein F0562_006644 [Nyssa sinensis]|uniref:Uncharacterized protein n=1 Tax=Nyssa sinensis TaxID=561372 RepID=A0A5J5AN28_9ASTE|nr:hypothetical protein F0562_006644 [Nyssa sinensis]